MCLRSAVRLRAPPPVQQPGLAPLAPCSLAVAMPVTAEWAAGIEDPQAQCLVLNAHALLLCNVALPLLAMWHLEQRARRRFAEQQEQAALAQLAAGGASQLQSTLQARRAAAAEREREAGLQRPLGGSMLDLYLMSVGVWAVVLLWASQRVLQFASK